MKFTAFIKYLRVEQNKLVAVEQKKKEIFLTFKCNLI